MKSVSLSVLLFSVGSVNFCAAKNNIYILVNSVFLEFTMSDEIAENGTANGDVPEIELIIKVCHFYTC